MGPKRKATGGKNPRPRKRTTRPTKSTKRTQDAASESPQDAAARDRVDVQWIRPVDDQGDDSPEAFAPLLFQRPWNALRNTQARTRLLRPAIRSPVYRHGGKATKLVDATNDLNQSSHNLAHFFDTIAPQTSSKKNVDGYSLPNFYRIFDDGDDNTAVVATREYDEPLALNTRNTVRVTVRPPGEDADVTNEIQILRLDPDDEPGEYFIQVPPLGSAPAPRYVHANAVTVNGQTFRNLNELLPLWIGPLEDFAVIELLTDPTFFWRSKESLHFDAKEKRKSAKDEEIAARMADVDVDVDDGVRREWEQYEELEAANDVGISTTMPTKTPTPKSLLCPKGDPCGYLHEELNRLNEGLPPLAQEPLFTKVTQLTSTILEAINIHQPDIAGFSTFRGNRALRPGRPIIIPLQEEDHPVLLVAQFNQDDRITLHILDPMYWNAVEDIRWKTYRSAMSVLLGRGWLYNIVDGVDNILDALPQHALWIPTAQQKMAINALFFVVLNAWALALGLEPDPEFKLPLEREQGFFKDAHQLFRLVEQRAGVDWILLSAFFRCYGFITDVQADPPEDRRFSLEDGRPSTPVQESVDPLSVAEVVGSIHVDLTVDEDEAVPHDDTQRFQADLQDDRFRKAYTIDVVKKGAWRPGLSKADVLATLGILPDPPTEQKTPAKTPAKTLSKTPPKFPPKTPPKTPSRTPQKTLVPAPGQTSAGTAEGDSPFFSPPEYPPRKSPKPSPASKTTSKQSPNVKSPTPSTEPDACLYFYQRVEELLEDENVKSLIDAVKRQPIDRGGITQGRNCLADHEPTLAIASVLAGINAIQDTQHGFGTIQTLDAVVVSDLDAAPGIVTSLAIRPQRPLLYSFVDESHIVLFVIQFDAQKNITINVLDSRRWHYSPQQRANLYERAWNIVTRTSWTGRFDSTVLRKPAHAFWIDCAQQKDDWICGHHTILNAWALLLGLQLNPTFVAEESFLENVTNLILLARVGHADWQLVYSFLTCHGFVLAGGHVPQSRRFTSTVPFIGETELGDYIDNLNVEEEIEGNPIPPTVTNTLNLGRGVPHDSRFPSDRWIGDMWCEQIIIPYLLDRGILNPRRGCSGLKNLYGEEFSLGPCDCKNAHMRLLHDYQMRIGEINAQLPTPPPPWTQTLSNDIVAFAIAAVAGAVDKKCNAEDSLPLGGLAMASDSQLQVARSGENPSQLGFPGTVTRPRRCWLLPLVIAGEAMGEIRRIRLEKGGPNRDKRVRAHTILAVLQEEATQSPTGEVGSEFHTYFLDSSPQHLEDVHEYLRDTVHRTADNLGWMRHRNPSGRIAFSNEYHQVRVPSRACGNKYKGTCGWHVIANAWILALGLTPAAKAQYTEPVYEELRELVSFAFHSILDWMTTASFFICHGLVEERHIHDVPTTRRFWRTLAQLGEDTLHNRISELNIDDANVNSRAPEDAFPYDLSSNVDFSRMSVDTEVFAGPSVGDGQQALQRGYESDGLNFLEGFSSGEGDVFL